MDYAAARRLIVADSRANLFGNRLVLIAPASSKASVQIAPNFPLAALLGNDRLAIADPDSVPAGKYAKAALESLGGWAGGSGKLARAQNGRAALVLVSLPLAVAVAHTLARSNFPGKTLFDATVHLPLVLPPVVVGYLLLLLFGRRGPIGAWLEEWFGIIFAFRWTGAALAAGIMGFPLMVRAVRLSFESIDRKLEAAASTLGAGRAGVFLTVTLPLALPGIITGVLLSFARSLGEFGATITFVSNIPGETRTLPLAI